MYNYERPTEDKILSILSHLFGLNLIVPLVLYFTSNNDYVKKHSKDSFIFNIIILILLVVFQVISSILGFITFGFFDYISGFLFGIGAILYFILILYGSWQIWNDKHFSYPYLSKIEGFFPFFK